MEKKRLTPMKPICSERILSSLRHVEKTTQQLSNELFVNRSDLRRHLDELRKSNKIHRQFFHNPITNRPDWLYSSVKYPPKYGDNPHKAAALTDFVGSWDAFDIGHCKR